jgi:flavin reductase (DIM6/NTAB) family NADH-FMN oxidoreductase RutF
VTTVTDREGVARLTRVAKPTDSTGGLMPPLRPPPQAPPPGAADNLTKREANPPAGAELLPQTGVARLTPKAPAVEQAAREFRQVMGRFATGVTVVTTVEMLPRSARYGVSVLSHDQQHFAAHFAAQKRSPIEPTFEWRNGLPLLEGALAHLVCRVADVHRAGDHVLWIGEVEYLAHQGDEPLLFYSGRFGTMREISDRAERGK